MNVERATLPDETPDTSVERLVDVQVQSELQERLDALIAAGWAVEWRRTEGGVICHLILFSSRRSQGRGDDADAAAREALDKLDAS